MLLRSAPFEARYFASGGTAVDADAAIVVVGEDC